MKGGKDSLGISFARLPISDSREGASYTVCVPKHSSTGPSDEVGSTGR